MNKLDKLSNSIYWKSALDINNQAQMQELQHKMADYYFSSDIYYSDINFTESNWLNPQLLHYSEVLKEVKNHERCLEVGCGSANLLKSYPELQDRYYGVDFSQDLINRNKKEYPSAHFESFAEANVFPYPDNSFDLVFSVFVLEHCVFPHLFLNECTRILRKGGLLLILCPDFLGKGRMSSQRVGFSQGTGREKWQHGKWLDALVTGFDNKIRMPLYASILRKKAQSSPRFFINIKPTCFVDKFQPDVDAVYLTYEKEIKKYLKSQFYWQDNSEILERWLNQLNLLLLRGKKI